MIVFYTAFRGNRSAFHSNELVMINLGRYFLMMETRNSFHGKGTLKKGTGLSTVKEVAEKYGGAMSIETQEKVFVFHVLLIIPQHLESIPRQMD